MINIVDVSSHNPQPDWNAIRSSTIIKKKAAMRPYAKLSDEARELVLFTENNEPLYRSEQAIVDNLDRKMQKGTYDPSKAPQSWSYLYEAAAKKYSKEFGGRWNISFPLSARKEACLHSAHYYELDFPSRLANGEVKMLKTLARRSR